MNIFKKAQGATEYLIILAIVIIIALIVVGAMGGIPGIGTGARSRSSASFWQTADIAIPAYALDASADTLNGTIRNNMRGSISNVQATISGVAMTEATNVLSAGQTTTFSGSITCGAAAMHTVLMSA